MKLYLLDGIGILGKRSVAFWMVAAIALIAGCKSDPVTTGGGNQSIAGTIYDSTGEVAVDGAQIVTEPPTQSVISGPHGAFVINNVPSGTYTVMATKPALGSGSVSISVTSSQAKAVIFLGLSSGSGGNLPPTKPATPAPSDGTGDEVTNVPFSWTASDPENDPMTYDVYMGTTNPPTTVVASKLTTPAYRATTLQKQTTYYWMVAAKDDHGNTTKGPVWSFTTGAGGAGKALLFDGESTYGIVTDAEDLHLSGRSFTLEAWVRPDAVNSNWRWILSKSNSDDDTDYLLALNQSNVFRFQTRNVSNLLYGTTSPTAGTWYHLAAVHDLNNQRVTLYVNGVAERTATLNGSVVDNTANLWVGARDEYGTGTPFAWFKGAFDEISIWDKALTSNEIRDGMNRRFATNEPGLIAYWRFDEGSGMQINDLTGHGHTINMRGTLQWIASSAPVQ